MRAPLSLRPVLSLRPLHWAALAAVVIVLGGGLAAQSTPEITFDANADILSLPSYGEVAGVATNSKGHVFVYARTGHAVATLGDERTFYHNGSRLFQFDQNGKFVKEIGQGVYAVNFAQQVRVDPQDNIWICLLYTSPSPRDTERSRMPSSA